MGTIVTCDEGRTRYQPVDGTIVPGPVDLATPFRGPFYYRPHVTMIEASPTAKRGGSKLQALTPPVPYVRMLTTSYARTGDPGRRRQSGRIAATGFVDPYAVRAQVPGLLAPDFRFVP